VVIRNAVPRIRRHSRHYQYRMGLCPAGQPTNRALCLNDRSHAGWGAAPARGRRGMAPRAVTLGET